MSSNDIEHKPDERGRFKHGTSRYVELSLQHELDSVARKSINELQINLDAKKVEPLSETAKTTRRLAPEFVPQKVREKRKSHPIFHDDLQSKAPRDQSPGKPVDVPAYNPLDKYTSGVRIKEDAKIKKFPYSKDETITTEEMKQPHITSVGIIPTRESKKGGINVLLEGVKAIQTDQDPVIGPIERANTGLLEPGLAEQSTDFPPDAGRVDTAREDVTKKKTKPAIISGQGTLGSVAMVQRPPPQPKARSRLRQPRHLRITSADSVASSLRSVEIRLPQQNGEGNAADDQRSEASSAQSVKSVKDLLEEAKQISTPEEKAYLKKRREKDAARGKQTLTARGADKKRGVTPSKSAHGDRSGGEKKSAERTVDQIISSLKDQSVGAGVSEADRKIQEIMDKVLTRTTAVLTNLGVQVAEEEPQEQESLDEPVVHEDEVEGSFYQTVPPSTASTAITSHSDNTDTLERPSETRTTEGEQEPTSDGGVEGDTEQSLTEGETPAVIREALEKLEECNEGQSLKTEDQADMATVEPTKSQSTAVVPELDLDQLGKDELLDLKQCYEDLQAPKHVTYEDILRIQAEPSQFHTREPPMTPVPEEQSRPSTATFLSSWAPVNTDVKPAETVRKPQNSVHHFCTMTAEFQLPDHLRGTWRRFHLSSKYGFLPEAQEAPATHTNHPTSFSDYPSLDEAPEAEEMASLASREKLDRVQSAAARHILEEAKRLSGDAAYEELRSQTDQMFQPAGLEIEGKQIIPKSDESFMHWTPAPPKWDVAPSKVKETLFPSYSGAALAARAETTQVLADESDESEEEEDQVEDDLDPEDRMARDRVLSRKYGSSKDLSTLMRAQQKWTEEVMAGRDPEAQLEPSESVWTMTSEEFLRQSGAATSRTYSGRPAGIRQSDLDSISEAGLSDISSMPPAQQISFADLRAKFSQQATTNFEPLDPDLSISGISEETEKEILPIIIPPKRRASAPGILVHYEDDEDFLLVFEDYNTAMDEINKQKKLLKMAKKEKTLPVSSIEVAKSEVEQAQALDETIDEEALPPSPVKLSIFDMKKEDGPTPAELALEAGRAYVLLPPKKKKKRKAGKMNVDMLRVEAIQNFLDRPGQTIVRSESLENIEMQPDWEFRVPVRIREKRGSVPSLLQAEPYLRKKGYKKDFTDVQDVREFVRDIWNKWFDQIFPPTPAESDWESDEDYDEYDEQAEQEEAKRKGSVASTVLSEGIDLDPVIEDEEDMENIELMHSEVDRLTEVMEKAATPSAFHHARRGALLRKLGKLKSAQDDLDQAIKLEPLLMDAYWHRHLLFILQNRKQQALDDLNFILKHNKTHKGAYRSRAAIYRQAGDLTMSIINYSQAIKLNPDDYDAYYQRAHMYEQRGEMLLAMEDYAQATRLMPAKTDALFKHGMHYFRNQNWQLCVNDFTELLKQEPMNAAARIYRGRAFSRMKLWNEAVEDLSAGIHLNPTNGSAFYYRGCILRKLHPKRALQDFSISLMIDDSEDNMLAYLHRGILYNEIGRHEDAIPDFEAVLKLDKDMAVAHVNLGLIYMLKMDNYHRAVKKFTQAIKSDPTYVKAYVCRAEAYSKVHDTKNALTDFTRAIHLRPDVNHYYMYRGQLVLRMGNLELAAFCVKHAAEMNAGLGHSPTQQAIVQSFLKNYTKAIDALKTATRSKPVASLFLLLGKTQMKARLWKDAVQSFERALEIVKPWDGEKNFPPEAAEMYYLIGMCQIETREYLNAHDAFNSAIRVDQRSADAFYYRGLVRMRLKQSKGIQDFNRALSIDPKLFQAYLSRAAYYGLRGQYTKAILNCNEAIKLQPSSVRAYLYRGALKYHIRAYKLAILDLSQAAIIDNQCALAYFNRAVCYQDSGEFQKALQDYGIVLLLGEALRLKVLINRGLLYFDRKDYHNALYDFLAAADNNPRDKKIQHTLGLCYHKLWRLKDAVTSFTKALKLDAFFLDAYIGRGNVFMDYGNDIGHEMARRDFTRCLHLDPHCTAARVNLGYNLQVMGRYQLAWHQFTTAINIDPYFKPALEGRAIINLQMSNTFAAFQDISASIHVKPTAELLTNRGVIYQFMGDRVNAMRDYQAALTEDTTYALAYFNAGNVYFHMRQFKQALAYYHQALQYNPNDESALLNRAIVKVLLRDSSGALKDFDKAISMSPHSAHMYFNRGNLYTSLKEYDQAEQDYTKALKLQPDDALVLKRRADVLGKLGRKDEAVGDYERAIQIQTMRKR